MDLRIRLERFENEADYVFFSMLAFNEQVMKMNMGRVFTEDEAKGFFAFLLEYNAANAGSGAYKVFDRLSGEFCGTCNLWIRDGEAEVEYMLLPRYWGRGYATESVKALLKIAADDPSVRKISGLTDPGNIASQKVLIKNGFSLEKTIQGEEDQSIVEVYSKM